MIMISHNNDTLNNDNLKNNIDNNNNHHHLLLVTLHCFGGYAWPSVSRFTFRVFMSKISISTIQRGLKERSICCAKLRSAVKIHHI